MILALCLILAACSSQPGSNSSAGVTTVSGGSAGEAAESAGETETSKTVDPSQIPSASADIFAMDTYMTGNAQRKQLRLRRRRSSAWMIFFPSGRRRVRSAGSTGTAPA